VAAADLEGGTFTSVEVEGWTLVDGTQVELSFDADAIAAYAGCNRMRGGFAVDGDTLTVDTLASTMMACEEPLQRQDEWLTGLLESDPTVALADDVLTLRSDDTTVRLRRQP
jgi:heat shock protein HslJ